ncbi:MAG TPA: T9SS type A sorting domain-containing protein [Candidatus Kapabacteria bacterium]|nr:T9SS type A sorting domain-containing protein [Candidatus Kapabacteria bacterium]
MTIASIATIASGLGLWLASGHDARDPRGVALHPGPIPISMGMIAQAGMRPALPPAIARRPSAGSPAAAGCVAPETSRHVALLLEDGRGLAAPHGASTDDMDPVGSIAGVRTVELSADELARIGVYVDTSAVWLSWQPEGESAEVIGISTQGTMFSPHGSPENRLEIPPFAPRLVTDDIGQKRVEVVVDDSAESQLKDQLKKATDNGGSDSLVSSIRRQINDRDMAKDTALLASIHANRLVAILVHGPARKGSPDPNSWRPDCILWFDPSRELLSRLPARIRVRLEAEIQSADALAQQHHEGRNSAEAAPVRERVAGERPYLDELRNDAGAVVESTLLPNPTRERALVSYRLLQPRVVEITLHDVAGRRLRQVAPPAQQPAGHVEVPIDVSGLNPGIYFVAILTDSHERAVQRLIVAP